MIKRYIRHVTLLAMLLLTSMASFANQDSYFVNKIILDPSNKASLQRGAKIYFNFCASCHSLSYIRYQQIAQITSIQNANHQVYTNLIQKYFLFDENANINQMIHSSMNGTEAKQWFGVSPPDLTNIMFIHTPAWLYNFLRGFYPDPNRPFGSNNLISPNTAMPNVLLPLRGEAIPVYQNGQFGHFRTMQAGMLTPLDFDRAMYDLVNFLAAVSEPQKSSHYAIGVGVILFLGLLLLLIYFWYRTLKHE